MYQVPPLMMQPLVAPPLVTGSVPRPEKGTPGVEVPVGGVPVDEVFVVEGGLGGVPILGRYFTSAGQLDLAPSGKGQSRRR